MSEVLFAEIYRPKKVEDAILPKNIKEFAENVIKDGKIPNLLFYGKSGVGKAQPLYSKILTNNGWKPIGEIVVGDKVITPKGEDTRVIGVYPQGNLDIYEIEFSDGAKTRACLNHLWECYLPNNNGKSPIGIVNTGDLIKFINNPKTRNVSIGLIDPKQTKDIDLPMSPYLLGVLLGDGDLSRNIKLTNTDAFILDKCNDILSEHDCKLSKISNTITYNIVQKNPINFGGKIGTSKNPIIEIIKNLGLIGHRSWEKFIPNVFLNSSNKQKIELLNGLLDTDGYVSKTGGIQYSTSSEVMAKQMQQIVWSLGGKCSIKTKIPKYTYKGIKKTGRIAYILSISYKFPSSLLTLPRKKERCSDVYDLDQYRRVVKSISFVGNEEAVCIMVEDERHLYVTDDYIITHNTTLARILAEQLGYDYIYINASLEGRSIDTVRTTITNFCTGVSLGGGKKLVILDEADGMTPVTQDALKGFFEQFSASCSFILTANNKHKINAPILSRFSDFEFVIPVEEKEQLKIEMMKRVAFICKEQSIRPEKEAIVALVNKHFPDFRKTLNQLQKLTTNKTLTVAALENIDMDSSELIQLLRRKDFPSLRKLVATTSNLSVEDVNLELWKHVDEFIKPSSIPSFVVLLSDYNVKANNVADQEVVLMAEFVELMSQMEFV